jgi:hypothetical protein
MQDDADEGKNGNERGLPPQPIQGRVGRLGHKIPFAGGLLKSI